MVGPAKWLAKLPLSKTMQGAKLGVSANHAEKAVEKMKKDGFEDDAKVVFLHLKKYNQAKLLTEAAIPEQSVDDLSKAIKAIGDEPIPVKCQVKLFSKKAQTILER